MAIEAERLLAVFEARFASLEKALDKARTNAQKSFGGIEDAGTRAEKMLNSIGNRGLPGVNRLNASMRTTRFETANVAAQFQDIAVTLASGQSPFLVALQQGTQLNQVLGGAGLRGSAALLGGAFASLLNPVSLATIGIIGLGGAAVQYFASVLSNAEPTAASLKEQADLIQRVADRWGDAVPALREYADELKRQQDLAERGAGFEASADAQYEKLRTTVSALSSDILAMLQAFSQAPSTAQQVGVVYEAFAHLETAVEDSTATAEDADRVHAALLDLFQTTGSPIVSGMADRFADLANEIGRASDEASRFVLPDGGPPRRYSRGGRPTIELPESVSETPESRPNDIQRLDWEDEARDRASRSAGATSAERERQAVADLITDLEFERSLIGMTALEREQANAVRRAGAVATEEQREKIESLVASSYAEREAIEAQEEAYRNLQRVGETALNGLVTAMADGKIEGEELLSVIISIARQLHSMPGGGGIGGILGAFFGGGFRANTTAGAFFGATTGIPQFAGGTRSAPGGLAWVGEKGRELVNLPQGSQVVPNHRLGDLGGTSMNYAPVYNVDAPGGDPREIVRAIETYDRGRLARLAKDLPELRRRQGAA